MKTNHSSLDTANDREGAGSNRNNVLQPKLQMLAGQCPRLHHRKPGRCAFCSIMFDPILVVWWFLMVLCHLQHVRHVRHVINITCHYVESTKQAFSSMTLVTFPCNWGLGPCAQCRGRLYSQHFPHTRYRAENSTRRGARKGWSWWNFGGYHGKHFIV